MIALWLSEAAQAVTRNIEVCLWFDVAFDDAAVGDHWPNNNHKAGRGVRYAVTDDTGSAVGFVNDNTGCVDLAVEVHAPFYYFTIRAWSRAEVNGIELQSHPSNTWDDQPLASAIWTQQTAIEGWTYDRDLPSEYVWQNLAVATWMMHRNKLHVDQDPSRDCCLEPSSETDIPSEYLPNGECGPDAPASARYVRLEPPIHLFEDPDGAANDRDLGCGGSTITDSNEVPHPALSVDDCDAKWLVSHELGHVFAEIRVGGQDNKDRSYDAPLDGCMADFKDQGATDPLDVGGGRGWLTKEHLSNAFREGWADFIAIWTWNDRTETDCVETVDDPRYSDIDLDGDVDNYPDKTLDCNGTPFVGACPSPCPMDQRNWLADMESWCDSHACTCDEAADPDAEANKSTVYDVSKMFWHHVNSGTGGTLAPQDLSDLYVDMCPRGWAKDDAEWADLYGEDADGLPLTRLLISAAANGLSTEVADDLDYIQP